MTVILEAVGLSKRFGGVEAVKDVSFELHAGEILGLIGPNGAGKTTLFNLVSSFIRPDRGTVALAGTSIRGKRPDEICRLGLCRTFQVVQPFGHLSVEENVMVGALARNPSMDEARATAAETIDAVGLSAYAQSTAATLTLGNRKRLEVARALATRPRVLLLDEVMGGLIPAEVQETVGLIRRLNAQGLTVLMIEHIMAAVMAVSHRVMVLHHGEKIADAPPASIARDPAVISAYLGEEYLLAAG